MLGAALAACSLLLAACATSKQIVLPMTISQHAYVIDCSGVSLSWSHCYREAGQTCPHGYVVKENPYKHGERIAAGDVLQLLGNSAAHRRMLIECRDAGVRGQTPAPGAYAQPDEAERSGSPNLQR